MLHNGDEVDIVAFFSSPENNALILADSENKDGNVFGIVEINDNDDIPKKFYMARGEDGVLISDYCEQGIFWKSKHHQKSFEYVDFNKVPIIKMCKKIINYMSEIEFK